MNRSDPLSKYSQDKGHRDVSKFLTSSWKWGEVGEDSCPALENAVGNITNAGSS